MTMVPPINEFLVGCSFETVPCRIGNDPLDKTLHVVPFYFVGDGASVAVNMYVKEESSFKTGNIGPSHALEMTFKLSKDMSVSLTGDEAPDERKSHGPDGAGLVISIQPRGSANVVKYLSQQ